MLFFTQAINLAEAEFSPFALPDAPHGIDNGCTSSFGRSSSLFFNGKNARPFSGASDGTAPKCYKSTTCFFAGRSTTMKKSLTALAVIGAFVGSAMAADVQLYGIGMSQLTSKLPIQTLAGALPLRFATPGYFSNMNRVRFVYHRRAVQGGIPMTANVNRSGSV